MIAVIFTIVLWGIALWLVMIALRRGDGTAREAGRRALREFLWLLPRLGVGVIGAGFLAKLLPAELVAHYLGEDAGVSGLFIATLAGMLTPGGPVVGFSLGTAALKSGAGMAQIIAYVTAWSLMGLNRMLLWELPIMPRRFVVTRLVLSLPLPLIAGAIFLVFQ